MGAQLQVEWDLKDHGWAVCRISEGPAKVNLSVSYCTDGLADLLSSIGSLYGTSQTARFFFDSEPTEFRWVLRNQGADVDVSIYSFPDVAISPDLPDEDGRLRWASTQSRSQLAHVVLEAAQRVLREHGEDGYLAKWAMHPFPVAILQDLRRLHLRHDPCDLAHDMTVPPK
ncbi:hypothetical protein [Streptomyces mirabilis]